MFVRKQVAPAINDDSPDHGYCRKASHWLIDAHDQLRVCASDWWTRCRGDAVMQSLILDDNIDNLTGMSRSGLCRSLLLRFITERQ